MEEWEESCFKVKQGDYNARRLVLTKNQQATALLTHSELWFLAFNVLVFLLPITGLDYSHKQPLTAVSHQSFSAVMHMLPASSVIHKALPDSVSLQTLLLLSKNTMFQKHGSLTYGQMKHHLMNSSK